MLTLLPRISAAQEVHSDILEAMVDLLSSGSSAGAPGTSTRVYCWGDLAAEPDQWQSIRTREEGRLISGGATSFRLVVQAQRD